MNQKKIAFFGVKYFPSKGGTSRVAESLIRELKNKYQVTIYCYPDKRSADHLHGVKVIHMPRLPFGAVGVFFYYALCCIHLLSSKRHDLIHVHKTDAAFFIPLLSWKSKIIATSHEAPYKRDKWNAVGRSYFKMMESVFMRSSAILTSVSKPLSDYYRQTYGRAVHYVPNGVEIDHTRNFEDADQILRKHGVKGEFLFFAARRIMSTKGCHTLLKAMKKLNYGGSIVIAGEDSHGSAYMTQIRSLAKGLNVKFIGFIGDKPTLMALIARAQFFMFPSEIEGLSLMLLEVASNGATPLICSDIPENTQVFTEQEVLYFQNKNADDLAEKFRWAENHPNEMGAKRDRAKALVLAEYSSAANAAKYDLLYQQILRTTKEPEKSLSHSQQR